MRPSERYAESFTVMPGRCFRLISRPTAHGQPDHFPERVAWRGTFTDRAGRRHEVDACDGHVGDLHRVAGVPITE
jgi:hypothetical protein